MKAVDYFKDDAGRVAYRADTARYGAEARAAVLAMEPEDSDYRRFDAWWPEWLAGDLLDAGPDDSDGFVYVIYGPRGHADGTTLVKVGYTSRHPLKRLCEIQRSSPSPLVLANLWRGSRHHEATLHRLLAASRTHGEWFLLGFDAKDALCDSVDHAIEVLAAAGAS